jgi:hypothetical protein
MEDGKVGSPASNELAVESEYLVKEIGLPVGALEGNGKETREATSEECTLDIAIGLVSVKTAVSLG